MAAVFVITMILLIMIDGSVAVTIIMVLFWRTCKEEGEKLLYCMVLYCKVSFGGFLGRWKEAGGSFALMYDREVGVVFTWYSFLLQIWGAVALKCGIY